MVASSANMVKKNEQSYTADPTEIVKGNSTLSSPVLHYHLPLHFNTIPFALESERGCEYFLKYGTKDSSSKLFLLKGDYEYDNNLRQTHFYSPALSLSLLTSLLKFVQHQKKVEN